MAVASTGILLIGFCLLILLVLIPVSIGIYVYRDASRRRMNAVLWTLIAVVTPVFVGLIIYLLVRGSYSDLECPVCNGDVQKDYTVCPQCGARLKRGCPQCGFPVEEGWLVCPRCATPLESEPVSITSPVHKKDNALWKLLLAVVLIPILLFLILMFNVSVSYPGTGSSSRISSYTPEDMEQYRKVPQIWDWLTACQEKNPEGIYVLHYREEKEEQKGSIYLIYRPSAGNSKGVQETTESGLFKSTMVISFEDTDDEKWNHTYSPVLYTSSYGDEFLGLEILVNGEPVDYEMTEIDFDPALELP